MSDDQQAKPDYRTPEKKQADAELVKRRAEEEVAIMDDLDIATASELAGYQLDLTGRERVITNLVVARLVKVLRTGESVREACRQAGISRDAYYDACKRSYGFAQLMEWAQEELNSDAVKTVRDWIKSDTKEGLKAAQWWLDRRDERFGQRSRYHGKEQNTNIAIVVHDGRKDNPSVDVEQGQ